MLNIVIIAGRITAKPKLKKTNSGDFYTKFTLAVKRDKSDITDFINFTCFKNNSENLCKYVNKGDIITVEGQLTTSTYKDNSYTEVKVEMIRFMNNNKATDIFNDVVIPEGENDNG